MANTSLFEQLALIPGLTLRNRIVMAPMTTWSANADATISDEEDAYYRRRVGGVGLVITGCSHVSANGIGFTDEFASHDDRFVPSLLRLAAAAKSGGAPAVLQIFHAGNKALPELVPDADVVSASDGCIEASTFVAGGAPVRALSSEEVDGIVADFGAATRRAIVAGFDGIELHGAHGFLLQNFLAPRSNQRTCGAVRSKTVYAFRWPWWPKCGASSPRRRRGHLRSAIGYLPRNRAKAACVSRRASSSSIAWSRRASTMSTLRSAICSRIARSPRLTRARWSSGCSSGSMAVSF